MRGSARPSASAIADFQALQFKLADMATELEAARTFLWRAAAALDAKAPDATKLCAMAKRFATDTGFEVANEALQLHGGYGYLADYGIEKIVRDLRVHQILEGTNEIMRLIIARDLVGRGSELSDRNSPGERRMTTIAFIGLGNMGGPMAANLVKARHRCVGLRPRAGLLRSGARRTASRSRRSPGGRGGAEW